MNRSGMLQKHVKTALQSVLYVIMSAFLVFTAGASTASAAPALKYTPAKSGFTVRVDDSVVLRDAVRKRDIPLKIYYPDGRGPFPVIIFSHGGGGSKDIYGYLGKYWAEHGYISIHPTHYGSDLSMLKIGDTFYNLRMIKKMIEDPKNLENRPKDISFIITSLGTIAQKVPALKGNMDASRIGVGGHSFGAYTTMAAAGALVDLPGHKNNSFKDSRITAYVALSPQAPGRLGFNTHSWDNLNVSILFMTGTKDELPGAEKASARSIPYQSAPPKNKYFVNIKDADHFTFSGGYGARQASPDHLSIIKTATLVFWDAYLRQHKPAKEYLNSTRLTTQGGGLVEYRKK